jgi:hypothetical protein
MIFTSGAGDYLSGPLVGIVLFVSLMNIRQGQKCLGSDKNSNLLFQSINFLQLNVYSLGPWGGGVSSSSKTTFYDIFFF